MEKRLKVLMFGWEFPPFNNGGLGTACYGLTKELSKYADITFVVPHLPENVEAEYVKLMSVNVKKVKFIDTPLIAYSSEEDYGKAINMMSEKKKSLYGSTLFFEVERYAEIAADIARSDDFDIIHAHDWMTYQAGVAAKNAINKPLVVHTHATEFDRTGMQKINEEVYEIEKQGMEKADIVMAVSNYTKNIIAENYEIPRKKIIVIHNAVDLESKIHAENARKSGKTVLFLGRVTLQKGPDYFVELANRVLKFDKDVQFIIAGDGDMLPKCIDRVAELGLGDKVLFSGFLQGEDVDRAYQMADLFVMPSVSEPFGITPLEAMKNNVPVIISNSSGVSEVLNNALKVDFWDINEMTNKIISVLNNKAIAEVLSAEGSKEVSKITWDKPAKTVYKEYDQLMNKRLKW